MFPEARQFSLPLVQCVPLDSPLMQEQRDELVASAGAGVHGLPQRLACRILRLRQGKGSKVDKIALGNLHARLLLDFLSGAAGEGAAVVEHAGRELDQRERGGRYAGLHGQYHVLFLLGVLGDVVRLEDELASGLAARGEAIGGGLSSQTYQHAHAAAAEEN